MQRYEIGKFFYIYIYLAQINETVYMFSNSKCPGQQ